MLINDWWSEYYLHHLFLFQGYLQFNSLAASRYKSIFSMTLFSKLHCSGFIFIRWTHYTGKLIMKYILWVSISQTTPRHPPPPPHTDTHTQTHTHTRTITIIPYFQYLKAFISRMIFRLLLAVDWWRYCYLICFPTYFQSSEYASKNCFWPSSQNVVIWCLWSSCSFSQCLGGWSTVRFPNKRAGEPTQQWVSNTFPEANWLLWEGFSFSLGTQEGVHE